MLIQKKPYTQSKKKSLLGKIKDKKGYGDETDRPSSKDKGTGDSRKKT